jgi:serine/threonine protein kinase
MNISTCLNLLGKNEQEERKTTNIQAAPSVAGSFQIYCGSFGDVPVIVKKINLAPSAGESGERYNYIVNLLQENNLNIEKLLYTETFGGFRTCMFEWSEGSVDQLFLPDDDKRKYHIDSYYLRSPVTNLLGLAKALAYIHSKGEFHGDIKPQNVLLYVNSKCSKIDLKWANFGLSNAFLNSENKDHFGLSGIRKSYAWQPVEIIRQIGQIITETWTEHPASPNSFTGYMQKLFYPRIGSVEADIFSTGCFFFYFLTKGFHPFGQGTNIPFNIMAGHMESLRKLPRRHFAYNILIKMMDILPSNRKNELDEIIQLCEIQRKRELYDVCSLHKPTQEDLLLLGRLIEDKEQPTKIDEPNEDSYTPLILLARNNSNENLLQAIKILFDSLKKVSYSVNCANITNQTDRHGFNPVRYLCLNYSHSTNLFEIINLLKENGLDFKQIKQSDQNDIVKFLFWNNHSNLLEILNILFTCGLKIDEDIKDDADINAEKINLIIDLFCKHCVACLNKEDVIKLLINNGAKPEHLNCLKNSECCISKILH